MNLKIQNDITFIRYSEYFDYKELKSVYIPESVTAIGSYSFYGCINLKNITIENLNIEIGDFAFNQTPFARVYKKLTTKKFVKFVNDKNKVKWIGKFRISIEDIKDLLGEDYKGYKEGISYGI